MMWSLLNHMAAEQVAALLDTQEDAYEAGVERGCSRAQAEAVIHAALWAYSSRAGSDASAYAFMNLMDALGVKAWSFDEEDRKLLSDAWMQRRTETARQPEPSTDTNSERNAGKSGNEQ